MWGRARHLASLPRADPYMLAHLFALLLDVHTWITFPEHPHLSRFQVAKLVCQPHTPGYFLHDTHHHHHPSAGHLSHQHLSSLCPPPHGFWLLKLPLPAAWAPQAPQAGLLPHTACLSMWALWLHSPDLESWHCYWPAGQLQTSYSLWASISCLGNGANRVFALKIKWNNTFSSFQHIASTH